MPAPDDATEDLRTAAERYRSIFHLVPVAVWEVDISGVVRMIESLRTRGVEDVEAWLKAHPEFVREALDAVRIVDVNDYALELYGVRDRDQLIRLYYESTGTPEGLEVFRSDLVALAEGRREFETEYQVPTDTGEPLHLLVRMHRPVDQPDRLILMEVDISARKRAEARLQEAQRMEALAQLTGGVAHDFNNLLTAVLGNIDLLRETLPQGSEARLMAEQIQEAAEHGANLTTSLLAFARGQPLAPAPVSLETTLGSMDTLLRSTLTPDIDFRRKLDLDLWPAMADATLLESSLVHLVLNARDAMPDGGRLAIEACNRTLVEPLVDRGETLAPGDYLLVRGTDTGEGMDAPTLARAFEPFFTTREVGDGSGLGLSMVYGFARQSRGHVRLHSAPGAGTEVELFLPRAVAG
jgi:signal transduction histidine kinase